MINQNDIDKAKRVEAAINEALKIEKLKNDTKSTIQSSRLLKASKVRKQLAL